MAGTGSPDGVRRVLARLVAQGIAQQHSTEQWSPVRDEEAASSNPVSPTIVMSQDIADGRTQ